MARPGRLSSPRGGGGGEGHVFRSVVCKHLADRTVSEKDCVVIQRKHVLEMT